jgi:hypothetical protein
MFVLDSCFFFSTFVDLALLFKSHRLLAPRLFYGGKKWVACGVVTSIGCLQLPFFVW